MAKKEKVYNPHVTNDYAPLETLNLKALRRFGDMHPGTVDGDVNLMFLEFANDIVEEFNSHPYRDGLPAVEYYESLQDRRPIHDNIILNGLIYHYAFQQASAKTEIYRARFYRMMNLILNKSANGTDRFELQIFDKNNKTTGTIK